MKRKLMSIALCLCLMLGLLPTAALAVDGNAASVWVNGVELTSETPYLASNSKTAAQAEQPESGGYAYFDAEGGTLTLSDYQNSTRITDQSTLGVYKSGTVTESNTETSDLWAAIYAEGDLNLVLSGTSAVYTKDGYSGQLGETGLHAKKAACVYVTGALSVSGGGSAVLNAGSSYYLDATGANPPKNYGIYADSLTVTGGTLTMEPVTTTTIEGNTYTNAKSVMNTSGGNAYAYGIYSAGSIAISGGSVTANSVSGYSSGSVDAANAYGVYAAGALSVGADAALTAGNYRNSMTSLANSFGIYSGGNMILSGTVAAAAKAAKNITTGMECASTLTIDGSAVVSAAADGNSYDCADNAYGIQGDTVDIQDSAVVTAAASYAGSSSYGIYGGTVTFSESPLITTTANGEYAAKYAVYAETTLSVPVGASYTNTSGIETIQSSTVKVIIPIEAAQPVVINCDPRIKVSFDFCNGSGIQTLIASDITALPTPTWKDYTLAGWYPAADGESAAGAAFTSGDKLTVDKAKALSESVTYYAKWTKGGKTVRTTPLSLPVAEYYEIKEIIDGAERVTESGYKNSTAPIDKSTTQGWKWEYDSETSSYTLTLSGANIDVAGAYALVLADIGDGRPADEQGSYVAPAYHIVLADDSTNTITAKGSSGETSAALKSFPALTISGSGSLSATGGTAAASFGIVAPLTVDGATVTATGGATSDSCGIKGDLTLKSGTVTANGDGYGLSCGSATISGGTLNATGANAGIYCNGGTFTIDAGGTVNATGKENLTGSSYGLGTSSADVVVNGSLIAKGGAGSNSYGAEIDGTLSGSGSITATGGTATTTSAGLWLKSDSTYSGTLSATGGTAAQSYGIYGIRLDASVNLPANITATCDMTANRHYPVYIAGAFSGLAAQIFTGSIVSKDGMVVYADDSFRYENSGDIADSSEFSALTVKANATLTIVSTAKLHVASADKITLESGGAIVNNGWIVLSTDTEATGSQIAALNITGTGKLLVGDTVYSNAGAADGNAVGGDVDLTDGKDASAEGKYTYSAENNELTINAGTTVLGDVLLPAGAETTVNLGNGAEVVGELKIEGAGAGALTLNVAKGESASIGGVTVEQTVTGGGTPKDFLLTLGGGGTLASDGISLSFQENYTPGSDYDMSVVVEENTTVNITSSSEGLGSGITIKASNNTGGLTVKGTLEVHTPKSPLAMSLPRIAVEAGASVTAGCAVAAELRPADGTAFTVARGGKFVSEATTTSIVIVLKDGQSIEDAVSIPSGYLPSGVTVRQFGAANLAYGDTVYTLARQDAVLTDISTTDYYAVSGGEAGVEIREYPSSGGSGGGTSTYTLTFETNGGSAIAAVSKTSGATVDLTGYVPTREGYVFAGWYSDEALTEKVTSVKLTKSMTIYAKWTKAETDFPFTDVASGEYYYDAVKWAVGNGVTSGITATAFAPNATCTRAQTVTFLWRAMGSPEPTTTSNPFTDVPADAYYYKAVLWAAEKGITAGTSVTTFAPDATVTRSQTVTFLWRTANKPTVTTVNPFTDVGSDDYFADAVVWAANEGITAGTSATTFAPEQACTRAQIVTFLYRYLGK